MCLGAAAHLKAVVQQRPPLVSASLTLPMVAASLGKSLVALPMSILDLSSTESRISVYTISGCTFDGTWCTRLTIQIHM
jgi:hypothetical protein